MKSAWILALSLIAVLVLVLPLPAAMFGTALVEPDSLGFGGLKSGDSLGINVTITNTGDTELLLSKPYIAGSGIKAFTVTPGNFEEPLGKDKKHIINVSFHPDTAATYSADLIVRTNRETITVTLLGEGLAGETTRIRPRLYATGGASTSADSDKGSGGGLAGLAWFRGWDQISGTYNFTAPSTVSGNAGTLGSSLLSPSTGTKNFQLRLGSVGGGLPLLKKILRRPGEDHWGLGWYGRFGGSGNDWEITTPPTEADGTTTTESQSGGLFQASVGFQLVSPTDVEVTDEKPNYSGFTVEFGLAYRKLMGDIAQANSSDFRQKAFGTTKRSFWSPEVSVSIKLGDVRPFATWTRFGGDTPGFSGDQIIFGVQAVLPLFPVNKESNPQQGESDKPESFQPML